MKQFHFSKIYFNKLELTDGNSRIMVRIKEFPSLEVAEERYSLRITTRHEEDKTIHRDYAIEHALPPAKHDFPHVQFKFHTEEIGQFRVRVDFRDQEEYRKGVLDIKISWLVSAIVIVIAAIIWMIMIDVSRRVLYGHQFWGLLSPGFGIIGPFLGTGIEIIGFLLSRKKSGSI